MMTLTLTAVDTNKLWRK